MREEILNIFKQLIHLTKLDVEVVVLLESLLCAMMFMVRKIQVWRKTKNSKEPSNKDDNGGDQYGSK